MGEELKETAAPGSLERGVVHARFQSTRRQLRNYYAAIRMGLQDPRDAGLGMDALNELIKRNEIDIAKDEAQHNNRSEERC